MARTTQSGKQESTIFGIIERETAAALLFTCEDENAAVDGTTVTEWFPLSQISRIDRRDCTVEDSQDSITVANWLLVKKGLA